MNNKVYIYALREQGTDEVRYIGQTIAPKLRLSGHRGDGDPNSSKAKAAWIGRVLSQGSSIEMDILEECTYDNAGERENFWMIYYRNAGHSLTNAGPAQNKPNRLRLEYVPSSHVFRSYHDDDLESLSDEEWARIEARMDRMDRMLLLICDRLGIDTEAIDNVQA